MIRINLTDDDITANRQGLLSDNQREMVRLQRLEWVAGTLGLAGVALGLLAILFLKIQHPSFAARGELFLIVPVMLFWLWVLRHMPQRWRQATRDLRAGQVAIVEGLVQTDFDFGMGLFRTVRHSIQVQEYSFRVSQAQQRLFKTGQTYRIYHTTYTHQFLGALLLVEEGNPPLRPPNLAEPLSSRELEVVKLIACGLTNQQIGVQLSLSVNTVKMYTSQLYTKLGVSRRTEAVARARELNLL
ncbi:MAG: hypothetical protein CVU39_19675 [Chloroflexi bacterium HGW-Chloroflexi-10]|nr:MAG: hypothetical protein CVU39_19675 [Chloroflexi bacterium HGW-Chloroflexi-10]